MAIIGAVTLAGTIALPASAHAATISNADGTSYPEYYFGNTYAEYLYSQGFQNQVAASTSHATIMEVVPTDDSWLGHPLIQLRPNGGSNCLEYDASSNTVIINTCGAGAPGSDSWWYADSGTLLSPNATTDAGGTRMCAAPQDYGYGVTSGIRTYSCAQVLANYSGEWLTS